MEPPIEALLPSFSKTTEVKTQRRSMDPCIEAPSCGGGVKLA